MSGEGGIGHNRLKSFVERVERLREEIDALNKDVSEVYKEAKGEGWNVQAIKALIAERSRHARDPEKFRELNDFVELYRSALESGTVVATRARVNLNSNPHTSTPEATGGEADGTLPSTASPNHSTRSEVSPPPASDATGDTAAPVSPTHSTQDARSPAKSCAEGGVSYALASPVNSGASHGDDDLELPAHMNRANWVDGMPPR